jgi:hypothetical protein
VTGAGVAAGTIVGGAVGTAANIATSPFRAFAYAPDGYGAYADARYGAPYPEYDSAGVAISPGAVGIDPGPISGAPANPCSLNLAQLNRC